MGCSASSPVPASAPAAAPSIYRDRSKRDNYILRNKNGGESRLCVVKQKGDIAGEQFVIEECEKVDVFLLDNIETMTVDLCKNMVLVTGPIKSR